MVKWKRLESQLPISQAANRFIDAASDFAVPRWSDHANRSIGLVKRLHTRRQGRTIAVANASVIRMSPTVATKGEIIPRTVSDVGMRPTWIARNTPPRVNIHRRLVARTADAALSMSACRRTKA